MSPPSPSDPQNEGLCCHEEAPIDYLTYVRVHFMIPLSVSEGSANEGVGARLKRLRLQKGFSQRDLSSPGVSYAYISRIEAGARTPSVKALRKLSQKLGVSVEYLETGRDIREVDDRELRLSDAELELRLAEDTSGAERKLQAILEEARQAGDMGSAQRARIALGLAAARRGSNLEAAERLEAVLSAEEHAPEPHMRPDLYTTLGQSYAALGAPERAVALFERSLERVTEVVPDDSAAQVRYATFLSYALTDAGEHERARSVVRDALSLAEGETDPYTRIRLYWSLARVAAIEGRSSEALAQMRRAIGLLEVTEDTLTLARGYLLSAGIESEEGRPEETRGHLQNAERLLGSTPEPVDLAMLRIGKSRLAALERDGDRAVECARDAIALLGTMHGAELGQACWALARGLALRGETDAAIDSYRRAVDLLSVHGRRHNAGLASLDWADMLQAQGRDEKAERIRARAYDLGVDAGAEATRKR
jgi:tetratricopeptide (TPR) repeat protein